jgi:hypothetical protein
MGGTGGAHGRLGGIEKKQSWGLSRDDCNYFLSKDKLTRSTQFVEPG